MTYYRIPETHIIQQLVEESGGALQFVFRVPFRLLEVHPDNADLVAEIYRGALALAGSGQLAERLPNFPRNLPLFAITSIFCVICGIHWRGSSSWPNSAVPTGSLPGRQSIWRHSGSPWPASMAGRACWKRRFTAQRPIWLMCVSRAATNRAGSRGTVLRSMTTCTAGRNWRPPFPEIRRLEQESERVLVLMNNPWRGQATLNARMLRELLEGRTTKDEGRIHSQ